MLKQATKTISEIFHQQTSISSFPKKTLDPKYWPVAWKNIYTKSYPRLALTRLPRKVPLVKVPFSKVLLERESKRSFKNEFIDLADMGTLLFYSGGIKPAYGKEWNESTRFYPSAGARYPLELYLVASKVAKLQVGLYHYSPKNHVLETLLIQKNVNEQIAKLVGQKWVSDAQTVFIITAVFGRTKAKYGDRGYRHILIEAGHLGQNIYLVATALGMKACAIGGFIDKKVNKLLDIDDENEAAVYIIAVGK